MDFQQIIDDVQREVKKERFIRTITDRKNAFINHLQAHTQIQKVGEGYFRQVFECLNDNYVIKVIMNTARVENNRQEIEVAKGSPLVPNVPYYDEDNFVWLVQEKVDVIEQYERLIHSVEPYEKFSDFLINNCNFAITTVLSGYLKFYYALENYNESFAYSLPLTLNDSKGYEIYEEWKHEEYDTMRKIEEFFFTYDSQPVEFTCHNVGLDENDNVKFVDPSTYQAPSNYIKNWVENKWENHKQPMKHFQNSDKMIRVIK